MVAGQIAHQTYQAERAAEDPHFSAEVTVRHRCVVHGWTVTIQGRVDGLVEGDGHWVVEEVKSTAFDASRLFGTGLDDWSHHLDQLRLYVWMVALDRPAHRVSGRLVLVSLADGCRHVLGLAVDAQAMSSVVEHRLADLVESRERRIAWMAARRRTPVHWPHESRRPGQSEVEDDVRRAMNEGRPVLVEAPTGLGKTAAVLTAVLDVALKTDRQIFWATTRTTQQPIVMRTLEAFAASGTRVRAVALNARTKVCLNQDEEGITRVACHPETCRFASHHFDKVQQSDLLTSGLERRSTRADVMDAGRTHEVCPYELSREMARHVDVVVGDLNYVLDPNSRLREFFEVGADGWIVVADEAHQLVDRARGYRSPRVSVRVARKAAKFLEKQGEAFSPFAFLARQVEDAVAESGLQVTGPVKGTEGVAILDVRRWVDLGAQIDEIGMDYALLKADLDPRPEEDPWLELARSVLAFVPCALDLDEGSLVVVDGRPRDESVRVCCLDPSDWVGPQLAKLGGFVAASATLRPVDFHLDLLGLRKHDPLLVQVESPFPPENQLVLAVPSVSTAYKDRIRDASHTGHLLSEAVATVPGNVVLFFASFAMMEDQARRLELSNHELLVQPRVLSEADRDAWLERLSSSESPVALCAVLGGIFAEGIDLPAGALSAVIVCGPAFPPVGLERDLLRDLYEGRYESGFLYASLVPGMTRVVQAAGRLIRRPEDRGTVVLIGRRFLRRDVLDLIPTRWDVLETEDPRLDISEFFGETC